MKKIFVLDANNVLLDLKRALGRQLHDTPNGADTLVLWNDIAGQCKEIAYWGKSVGKEVIVMQHGRGATRDYAPPNSLPLTADKIMVWGKKDKDRMLKAGVSEDRIFVTGTTIFDHLKPRYINQTPVITFAPIRWNKIVPENKIVADRIYKYCQEKGYRMMTKNVVSSVAEEYPNTWWSNNFSDDHIDKCVAVLRETDVVVDMENGTFALLAMAMNIPVVWCDIAKLADLDETRKTSQMEKNNPLGTSYTDKLDGLEYAIKRGLLDSRMNMERKQVCIDDGGFGKKALENILKCVKGE